MSQDAAIRQATDPVQLEILRRRAGEPYAPGVLLEAGAISWGEAHLDHRAGQWGAAGCYACCGSGMSGAATPFQVLPPDEDFLRAIRNTSACPSCLGTGRTWSEKHAELMAYAGEASLREVVHGRVNRPPLPIRPWVAGLSRYSPHAALAAALGVSEAWLATKGGMSPAFLAGERRALDAVRAWLWDPSEDLAKEVQGGVTEYPCPVSALCLAVTGQDLPQLEADVIYRASLGPVGILPPDAISAAARRGVLEWAGRGVLKPT